jgi:hypothetical protein
MMASGLDPLPLPLSRAHGPWFLGGLLYMQLLEYAIHRFLMHGRIPGSIRLGHIEHHRIFHGDRFRSRNAADLATIPGRWWIFPVSGGAHYVVLSRLLPPGAATVVLFACALHYAAFELTHWFTHVDGNVVDRVLGRVRGARTFWSREIEYHRGHHETPVRAFNFSYPYLGDLIADGMPRPARKVPESVP